jgi:hypothetical protein
MRPVEISSALISETITHLQAAGRNGKECVVLWLAEPGDQTLKVKAAYRPEQFARADVFRIPPDSMRSILQMLAANDLMICAQVHSHPMEAFHSRADDAWAIVRHRGALSLVLPYFASRTTLSSFLAETKTFQLSAENLWIELSKTQVSQCLLIR